MVYQIRRSHERKFFDHGWLKTYHTFSFGHYYDPHFMGFRDLRVINEDRVAPKMGFPPHSHEDMEIITIILEGELAHKDSTGSASVIRSSEVQTMSAGTGITHSEYNSSEKEFVHFLQIWIFPDEEGITPQYNQREMPFSKHNDWILICSKEGKEGSLKIHQDVKLYSLTLDEGKDVVKNIPGNRFGWLQVISGDIKLNHDTLTAGDGAAIENITSINIKALTPSRILFFDLK